MVDKELLVFKMRSAGFDIKTLAQAANIPCNGLYKRLNGKICFNTAEVSRIAEILHLTGEDILAIFYYPKRA